METPSAQAPEKKDKMEGNVFSDLGKKPSETRGKRVFRREFLLRNQTLVSGLHVEPRCGRMSRRCSAGGQRGPNEDHEIYISKKKCHLGS